ncbi:MAG: FxLYD domain-containing protein, partial [Candidatus Taylorbacteria bacterium]|nr:FxLYD domain-containing protein [Candidatus Taylorbacteria bacterium]
CKAEALDVIVRWQRAFRVKEGVYNALAYVENPNLDSGAREVPYRFKLYDADNVLIYERKGTTFIPPKKVFGIFESTINTGTRVPARTLFEFLTVPVWEKTFAVTPSLSIGDKVFSAEGIPRVTASLVNKSEKTVYNVEVVVVLYDSADNAIATSRTVVDRIERGESTPLVFTWSDELTLSPSRIELIYRPLDF